MLTGTAKDILDAHLRGEVVPGITKGLLNTLVDVHARRTRSQGDDAALDRAEHAAMEKVDALIRRLFK